LRIEHVLSPADNVFAEKKSTNEIYGGKRLENQQPYCLPRENQTALGPQSDGNQKISDVTEIQKVLCAILPPINRRPHQQPDGPYNLEPNRDSRVCGWIFVH